MFKKWVREVRDWKDRARLTTNQSLQMLGKYLGGQAYRFFEQDVLDLQKNYLLTEFFEQLKHTIHDYLRRLRDLADTAGDVSEHEIVQQFWMNCKPYIKVSIVDKGYEPNSISLETIEKKALHTEHAFLENSHDPHVLLALNPTAATSITTHNQCSERHDGNENRHQRMSRRDCTSSISTNAIHPPNGKSARPNSRKTHGPNQSSSTRVLRDHPKKSDNTIKRLRENDQCFECEQKGHLAKDCPKRHKLPYQPSNHTNRIHASTIGISDDTIRHAAIKEGIASGLFRMAVNLLDPDEPDREDHSLIIQQTLLALRKGVPLPMDEIVDPLYDPYAIDRFTLENWGGPNTYLLSDKHNYDSYIIYFDQLKDDQFDTVAWLTDLKLQNYEDLIIMSSTFKPTWCGKVIEGTHQGVPLKESTALITDHQTGKDAANIRDECPELLTCESSSEDESDSGSHHNVITSLEPILGTVNEHVGMDRIYCGGSHTELLDTHTLHRNAAHPKSSCRILPKALVVVIHINDHPCHALLDSGSLTDFLSTTIVDQLKLKIDLLDKPIPLQLAVSGS
ncbi:hypothetical protein BDR05DRAFT_1003662 [Suillus weaverae]|nr:hypothetical protein BDR05DRAFT_1003662 [Suillus weaverae]